MARLAYSRKALIILTNPRCSHNRRISGAVRFADTINSLAPRIGEIVTVRKRPAKLNLVALEDRSTPATTYMVSTTADSGSGSLRQAITLANASPGLDTIDFDIPGTGVQTIMPTAPLPFITDPVKIDGTSQPGFASTPLIRIVGTSAGPTASGLELLDQTGSTIQSLSIAGFSGAGIEISGGGSTVIYGSLIGTNSTGTAADANGIGILITTGSLGNTIGGNATNQRNTISGNGGPGIRIDNSYNNIVAGNFIGTDITGSGAIANGGGVSIIDGAVGNSIGGLTSGLGNIISGNAAEGVLVTGATTSSNNIVGNRIGQNFGGSNLPNSGPGIQFSSAADSAPSGGASSTTENTVSSNTIVANTGAGVAVLDTSRQVDITNNSIHGNGSLGIQVDDSAQDGLAAPTISSVAYTTGGQTVTGSFTALATTKYDVTIYTNSTATAGQGQTQITTVTVTTDSTGAGTFTYLLLDSAGGAYVTATVTNDSLGDTSEFSNASPRPNSLLNSDIFAVGGGAGGPGTVIQTDTSGETINTLNLFSSSFTGGVRVATGDLTGDGIPDIAVGTGPGTQAEVEVLDGSTQAVLFTIFPFDNFTGGVFVAMGDVNDDGAADIVITPDEGGGPRVRVFSGKTFTQLADFYGINDPSFRGGCRAAVGDINHDGYGDLIVSAGYGGGPRIAVYNGKTLTSTGGPELFSDFFAFESTLRNGAYVTAGDVNGDGYADMIVAAGPGGAPRVRVLDGKTLTNDSGQQTAIADFFAGSSTSREGVRVMARDFDGDGKDELVTGDADGNTIMVYEGSSLATDDTASPTSFSVLAARPGGMFVG